MSNKQGRKINEDEIAARNNECRNIFMIDGIVRASDQFRPGVNICKGIVPSFSLGEMALSHPQGVHDTFVLLPHIDLNVIEI